MVICHALTGSSDVTDWWGPLLGPGRAFDPSKFFIVCLNSLGSPYGSASACTLNPDTGTYYGPEFPLVTIKDDVRIHKLVLDDLGVKQIAAVIGGSMGGMLVLEYAFFGPDYVRCIVPLATSACHSAWGISWGETQRQSIYSDPKYDDGYYSFDDPPVVGLSAARMAAMLTYRSRNSFEAKFGRTTPDPKDRRVVTNNVNRREPSTSHEHRWAVHNHGHFHGKKLGRDSKSDSIPESDSTIDPASDTKSSPEPPIDPNPAHKKPVHHFFSAQSYLRYQGQKFVQRFDANCYISITRKLDSHDISRGRGNDIPAALATIQQPTLVIGISSDNLFTFAEQQKLAQHIPHAELKEIESQEGHDAFLLEFADINHYIFEFLKKTLPDLLDVKGVPWDEQKVGQMAKSSVFGEAEGEEELDIANW